MMTEEYLKFRFSFNSTIASRDKEEYRGNKNLYPRYYFESSYFWLFDAEPEGKYTKFLIIFSNVRTKGNSFSFVRIIIHGVV